MPLKIVATPIGNPGDLTPRAREALLAAEAVIGEERRIVSTLLKSLGREGAELHLLNEHSADADIESLLDLCRRRDVALISDAGTPGFCDPGARLVAACREAGVSVTPLPGASSLMCLLSMSGVRLDTFLFRGFLPAERVLRERAIAELKREPRAVIVMDTPYRLGKLMSELSAALPERRALLGLDFTLLSEEILEGTLTELARKTEGRKAEFMLLIHAPEAREVTRPEREKPAPQSRGPGPWRRFEPRRPKSGADGRRNRK